MYVIVFHVFRLFSGVVRKTFFGIFKNLSPVNLNVRIFAVCLVFLDVICHVLISNMACLVNLNLESLTVFLCVRCDYIL